jgi:hypothetical protein
MDEVRNDPADRKSWRVSNTNCAHRLTLNSAFFYGAGANIHAKTLANNTKIAARLSMLGFGSA